MAKRRIMTGDAECLYKVCRKVDNFDKRLAVLLDDMAETMYDAEGVGLAAPQVGILKRAVVIDCGDGLVELINPEILEASGEQGGYEGCLSFPGESGYVVRPNHVRVRAMNRFGEECEYEGEGLFARAILHETDHLNGLVYKRLVTEAPEGYDENEEDE
ncbi:MAG: peptide deformylase [Eubacteriales bacterium]|jgi:peptide deformylase|nr:peptide deformylase [Eubacteriales bacterium]CCX49505.1 peptide deformylase 2 [Clostridium sp. CAG:226]